MASLRPASWPGLDQAVALLLGVGVARVALAPLDLVERRGGEVDVAGLDERAHEPEQQGQQQRGDVLAVDVGVGHQHDLVVAQLGQVEVVVDAGAERGDQRLHLVVLQHPVDARLLDVDDLAADREDRLEHRVPARLRRAAGGVALDDVQLALARVGGAAVGELARHAEGVERVLAGQLAGLLGGLAGPGGLADLRDDRLGLGRVALEPRLQPVVADAAARTSSPRSCRAWSWSGPRTAVRRA